MRVEVCRVRDPTSPCLNAHSSSAASPVDEQVTEIRLIFLGNAGFKLFSLPDEGDSFRRLTTRSAARPAGLAPIRTALGRRDGSAAAGMACSQAGRVANRSRQTGGYCWRIGRRGRLGPVDQRFSLLRAAQLAEVPAKTADERNSPTVSGRFRDYFGDLGSGSSMPACFR